MSLIDSYPIRKAPAIFAVISSPEYGSIIDAGRLMERLWINLNANGLAVHPYYVVADQLNRRDNGTVPSELKAASDSIFSEVNQFFDFEKNENLQMLFRVGYPKKTAIRSRRLPIEQIISP
jgi:hypothetical protein